MENLEQTTPDVTQEASSAPVESSSEPNETAAKPEVSKQVEKEPPFHEHPRFKELINYKNEASQRLQEYEKQIQSITKQLESRGKEESPETKLLSRLKGIDAEFGAWAEAQQTARAKAEQELAEFRTWKQNSEHQNYMSSARSAAERAQAELKVDSVLHDLYLRQIQVGTPIDQIPGLYRQLHDKVSKVIENSNRTAIASYSKDKVKDSAIPTPAKGVSPKQGPAKLQFSKNPEEARRQVVAEAVKRYRSQG